MTNIAMGPAKKQSEKTEERVTILIEPRSLTRQCFSAWLEQGEPDMALRAFGTPLAAVDHRAASITLIIWSTGASSIASSLMSADLKRLRQSYPAVPLAMLADRDDPADIREAIRRGVNGYVSTSLDRREALEVLRFIRAGGTYVPASALVDADLSAQSDGSGGVDNRPARATFDDLTPREADVVERLRLGKPNKVIAHELEISESTVKVFVHRILHKLGAVNRTEVAYLAQQWADRAETRSEPVV
ncbi:MAG: response regulator transcription factor [Alphaproteobacteria bacterium]|nr:response regulator transcription factor [Alphaproteobacteria bacterium]